MRNALQTLIELREIVDAEASAEDVRKSKSQRQDVGPLLSRLSGSTAATSLSSAELEIIKAAFLEIEQLRELVSRMSSIRASSVIDSRSSVEGRRSRAASRAARNSSVLLANLEQLGRRSGAAAMDLGRIVDRLAGGGAVDDRASGTSIGGVYQYFPEPRPGRTAPPMRRGSEPIGATRKKSSMRGPFIGGASRCLR